MKFNIIETIEYVLHKIKYIIYVYFTTFPYLLHEIGNNSGNMGISGIGLGLIDCQKIFWISNIGVFLHLLIKKYYINLYFINIFLYLLFIYLYISSLLKTICLIKYLKK